MSKLLMCDIQDTSFSWHECDGVPQTSASPARPARRLQQTCGQLLPGRHCAWHWLALIPAASARTRMPAALTPPAQHFKAYHLTRSRFWRLIWKKSLYGRAEHLAVSCMSSPRHSTAQLSTMKPLQRARHGLQLLNKLGNGADLLHGLLLKLDACVHILPGFASHLI